MTSTLIAALPNKMKNLNDLINSIASFNGKIIENEFNDINENIPLHDQLTLLDEDMLFIKFNNNFALDIGWYCHFKDGDTFETYKKRGSFIIHVAQNSDWDNPLLRIKTRTFSGLKKAIKKALAFIMSSKNLKLTK